MATYNQSLRTLYVMQYLLRYTDEEHHCSRDDLIAYLAKKEIEVGRKSIYADIDTLGPDCCGLDLQEKNGEYWLASHDFDLREVQLLADMIQASNFIGPGNSKKLIGKLQHLVSEPQSRQVVRNIRVFKHVKSSNEGSLNSIERISQAIGEDRALHFRYFKYDVYKKKFYHHGGKLYTVSPFALIWGDGNYYLLAWDHESQQLRHYRIDRMEHLAIDSSLPRQGKEAYRKIDMSSYPAKVFHMFRGEEVTVRLRFREDLADAVLDRFGDDVIPVPEGDGTFTVTVPVLKSPQFYGWLAGFGDGVEILSPEYVRQEMREHLEKILKKYEA